MKSEIKAILLDRSRRLRPDKLYLLGLMVLLSVAFFFRVSNLNYNTPFVDEAAAILIGKLGLFQGDWYSYSPASWMPTLPFIDPLLSALAYVSGGITGSRLLSVIFGLLAVEMVAAMAVLISGYSDHRRYIAGIIAAVIVAFSPVSFFVSKLSTYDIKSFCLFLASVVFLLRALSTANHHGQWYFLASLTLVLSFMVKIIFLIYLPPLIALSFLAVRSDRGAKFYWERYFLLPLLLLLTLYIVNYLPPIIAVARQQLAKETHDVAQIIWRARDHVSGEWLWGLVGTIGMLSKRNHRLAWLLLLLAGLLIIFSHVVTQRAVWTMDKHLFVTVAFLSVITGVGITNLLYCLKTRVSKLIFSTSACLCLAIWSIWGYQDSRRYDSLWPNSASVSAYLKDNVTATDKVLSQAGAAVMLSIYDQIPPFHTTTFDFFKYGQLEGKDAYAQAVKDAYFNFIVLANDSSPTDRLSNQLSRHIRQNLDAEYKLAHTDANFQVYRRLY